MATFEDVRRLALALPGSSERRSGEGLLQWRVRDRMFAWERPLLKTELAALGDAAPQGPLLAVRVADEVDKHAVLAERPDCCLTTPHFDGFAAVLVQLDRISPDVLVELVTDSWRDRAGPKLGKQLDAG